MGIYLTDSELQSLDQAEGVLVKAYLWLRTRMDRRTRLVGRVTSISLQALAEHCEWVIPKGQGVQVVKLGDTPKKIKDAATRVLERLERIGLLVKQGGPLLCFLCPMADAASVRPNQTGAKRATELPTERANGRAVEIIDFAGICDEFEAELATRVMAERKPNGRHIIDQGVYTSQSSSTTGRGVASSDDVAGVNRDRPLASQAGSLRRPGETHEDPYRDRPAGSHVGPQGADFEEGYRDRPPASHPAPARRLAAQPQPGGASPDVQCPNGARSSAEKESFANGMSPDAADRLLRAVLDARGVRVQPSDSKVLAGWVSAGISADELDSVIERARAARLKAGSTQSINLPYLAQIVSNDLAAAERAAARLSGAAPRAWRGGVADLEALARRLRISGARPGEDAAAFRARVSAAWQAQQQEGGHGAA